MQDHDVPEKVTLDKSGANKAAIDEINRGLGDAIVIRQIRYLNNIVEQDHRAVKRVTKPSTGLLLQNARQRWSAFTKHWMYARPEEADV